MLRCISKCVNRFLNDRGMFLYEAGDLSFRILFLKVPITHKPPNVLDQKARTIKLLTNAHNFFLMCKLESLTEGRRFWSRWSQTLTGHSSASNQVGMGKRRRTEKESLAELCFKRDSERKMSVIEENEGCREKCRLANDWEILNGPWKSRCPPDNKAALHQYYRLRYILNWSVSVTLESFESRSRYRNRSAGTKLKIFATGRLRQLQPKRGRSEGMCRIPRAQEIDVTPDQLAGSDGWLRFPHDTLRFGES
jgi:hypothetical protein